MLRLLVILALISTHSMAQKLMIAEPVKFLALGDSYTIGESVSVRNRWPMLLIDSLEKRGVDCLEPTIMAVTGWRTDNLKSAITKTKFKQKYNLVSLSIGVNNYFQRKSVETYKTEFEELLRTAIRLADGRPSHVFVLSIPDYGFTPFGKDDQENITTGIDKFNDISEAVAQKLGVPYFSITEISRKGLEDPELVAPDGLHPSGKMYAQWVARILRDAVIVPEEKEDEEK